MVIILASMMMTMKKKKIASHRRNEAAGERVVAMVVNGAENFGAVALGSSRPFKRSFVEVTKSSFR
jgi:hypothetical protein